MGNDFFAFPVHEITGFYGREHIVALSVDAKQGYNLAGIACERCAIFACEQVD